MENFDLDIENYELKDLLNLFSLTHELNETDLKKAKKIVLKMHPDQSHLDAKYFLFFSKAYKIIYSIFIFKNNQEKGGKGGNPFRKEHPDEFMTREQKQALDDFLGKMGKKKFHAWFNQEFEKNKIHDEEEEHGYGDWIKSDEGMMPEFHALGGINHGLFDQKKREMNALCVKEERKEEWIAPRKGASNVVAQVMDDYSSELFSSSSLTFQDLKKAYNESIIPVDVETFEKTPRFNSVSDYQLYRESSMQKVVPLSLQQANECLLNRQKEEDVASSRRAFELAKQWEQIQTTQQTFWGGILKIKNI
jgi:hypothetical protein